MTAITAAELAHVRIARRRSGQRYAIDAVDAFLDEAVASLKKAESGMTTTLAPDDVTRKQFPAVGLLGVGYDADAVDELLDRVAAQLNRRGQNSQQTQVRAAQDAQDEAMLRGMLDDIKKNLGQRRDG